MNDSPRQSKHTTARLKRYLLGEARGYGLGVLALLLTNLAAAGIPYVTKLIFDALSPENGALAGDPAVVTRQVSVLAAAIAGLAVLMAFFRVISRILIFNGGRHIEHRLRGDIYAHLQQLGPVFFGRIPVGDLVSRVSSDITALRLLGGPGILNLANTVIVYFAAVIPMLLLSPTLTAAALSPVILVFALTRTIGRRLYVHSYETQQQLAVVSALANESITGIGVLRSYAREQRRQQLFTDASDRYREVYLSWVLLRSGMIPILVGMGGLGTLCILYFGGARVIEGSLTLGDFVAFIGYLGMLMWPTVALGWMMSMWQRGRAGMDRLGEVFDTEPEVVSPAPSPGAPTEVHGGVRFSGLSFAYPGSDGVPHEALHDIHLRIEPGESVLVVGPSGAGKTTLVSLLPHLSAVPAGSLFIDDVDIDHFDLALLRERVGFVPQWAFLFSMTIRENIAFGGDDPALDAVKQAARMARLTGDIERFPEAWDTLVGERGVTLSGGQRQRMTIARAAFTKPAIWVFDDCLSSVDAGTEQHIIRNLRELTKEATAIFVSHRLLGFERVDRIVVLQEGRITEQGTHDELLGRGGWYARLYKRQRLDLELSSDGSAQVAS